MNSSATFRSVGVSIVLSVLLCAVDVGTVSAQCTTPPPVPTGTTASVTTPGTSTRPATVVIGWAGVPTTGPNAASTYILDVGNAPGVTNVVQVDIRSTVPSTRQSATNGTYYVRVRSANSCGLSAPSSEASVAVAGTIPAGEPAVGLVGGIYGEYVGGNTYVMGEVSGSWGSRAASFVKIDTTLLGADGQQVGTDFGYINGRSRRVIASRVIDDTTLGAGEGGCFMIFTEIPITMVSQVFATSSWSNFPLEVLRGNIVVQNVQQEADPTGLLVLRGQARNAGTVATYLNEVMLDARNAQNTLISCDYEFVQGSVIQLPPGPTDTALAVGQTGSFVNYNGVMFSEVVRVNTWAGWEEADTGATSPTAVPLTWQGLASGIQIAATDREGRVRLRRAAIDRLRQRAMKVE